MKFPTIQFFFFYHFHFLLLHFHSHSNSTFVDQNCSNPSPNPIYIHRTTNKNIEIQNFRIFLVSIFKLNIFVCNCLFVVGPNPFFLKKKNLKLKQNKTFKFFTTHHRLKNYHLENQQMIHPIHFYNWKPPFFPFFEHVPQLNI